MAAEQVRCGVDAFGNPVCLNKDGAAVPAPKSEEARIKREADKEKTDAEDQADVKKGPKRCGIDPFGNTVCN